MLPSGARQQPGQPVSQSWLHKGVFGEQQVQKSWSADLQMTSHLSLTHFIVRSVEKVGRCVRAQHEGNPLVEHRHGEHLAVLMISFSHEVQRTLRCGS